MANARGAWALEDDAPEAQKGFLLNHLIHELLPPKGDGMRWANSDPVTGQAAWFDLRVRLEKTEAPDEVKPNFNAQGSPVGTGPEELARESDARSFLARAGFRRQFPRSWRNSNRGGPA